MKFLSEYRDPKAAEQLAQAIRQKVTRPWTIMEVCGGQTHTIVKNGLEDCCRARSRWCTAPAARSA